MARESMPRMSPGPYSCVGRLMSVLSVLPSSFVALIRSATEICARNLTLTSLSTAVMRLASPCRAHGRKLYAPLISFSSCSPWQLVAGNHLQGRGARRVTRRDAREPFFGSHLAGETGRRSRSDRVRVGVHDRERGVDHDDAVVKRTQLPAAPPRKHALRHRAALDEMIERRARQRLETLHEAAVQRVDGCELVTQAAAHRAAGLELGAIEGDEQAAFLAGE